LKSAPGRTYVKGMMPVETVPFSSEMRVREALDRYFLENGFSSAQYAKPWTTLSFLGADFTVPNPASRRRAIPLHDLHHVATGFGTDLRGEGQISAWEVGARIRGVGLYVAALIASGVVLGAVLAPKKAWAAYRAGRGARSLFPGRGNASSPPYRQSRIGAPHSCGSLRSDVPGYEALLDMTVGELREWMGLPRDGLEPGPRGLHASAPRGAHRAY
jgi:hypothetical protein